MDIKQSLQAFRNGWEARTGATSPLSRSLSPEGRNAWRIIREMPEKTAKSILKGITLKMPADAPSAVPSKPEKKFVSLKLLAILPPALCAVLCACFVPSVWLATLITFAVTAGAGLFMNLGNKPQTAVRQSETKPQVTIDIDEAAINQALNDSEVVLRNLIDYLAGCEADAELGHDITQDKGFGEWVQKFVNHANRHEENQTLNALKGELITKLGSMGITVYGELETDDKGAVVLPNPSYFTDARTGEQYAKVTRTIVYSRRKLLAKGEIT